MSYDRMQFITCDEFRAYVTMLAIPETITILHLSISLATLKGHHRV